MKIFSMFWTSSLWKKARRFPFFPFLRKCYWKFDKFYKSKEVHHKTRILLKKAQYLKCKEGSYEFGEIFVSLTTYPLRIESAYFSILSILDQTIKPNKVILTLIKDEFPCGEDSLPTKIKELKSKGLEISWGETNLRPHNKYFYSMQKYPKASIITIDDDILYPRDTIEKLTESYQKFPKAISALHTDKFNIRNNQLDLYSKAIIGYNKEIGIAKQDLLAEGFAGVLYPPSILPKETFNKDLIKKCAPIADDIWLKCIELKYNIPVVCADTNHNVCLQTSVQDTALFNQNRVSNLNDSQLKTTQEFLNIRIESHE